MNSDAEREVLARLRGASQRASVDQIEAQLADLPLGSAPSAAASNLAARFLAQLRRNGASTAEVADRAAAIAELSRYIAGRHAQRRVVTGQDPRLAALPWRDGGLLPRFDTAQVGDAVSVSYARRGVAETGSLALWVNRDNPALNNLLCEDHVILLDRSDIHPTLEAVWADAAWGDASTRPRGMMLISGPSSTADIEMQLVRGAHGPRALHVILLGKEPAATHAASHRPQR